MRALARSGKIPDRRDTCTVGRERSMGEGREGGEKRKEEEKEKDRKERLR